MRHAHFIILASIALATPALAQGLPAMTVVGPTSQPIGHYEFCQVNHAECAIRMKDTGPLTLTDAIWKEVVAVNIQVNERIIEMTDKENYGRDEVWAYPRLGMWGDCEDIALEKRRELSQIGIPINDLLMTVVRLGDGEGHAVLTLRTSEGDYILDNLIPRVELWYKRPLDYIKRQSTTDVDVWVALAPADDILADTTGE